MNAVSPMPRLIASMRSVGVRGPAVIVGTPTLNAPKAAAAPIAGWPAATPAISGTAIPAVARAASSGCSPDRSARKAEAKASAAPEVTVAGDQRAAARSRCCCFCAFLYERTAASEVSSLMSATE